jgi:hypothetical protein
VNVYQIGGKSREREREKIKKPLCPDSENMISVQTNWNNILAISCNLAKGRDRQRPGVGTNHTTES